MQNALEEAITDAGFEAKVISQERTESSSDRISLKVSGMTCSSCSKAVESALKGVKGVHTASVNLLAGKAEARLVLQISPCAQCSPQPV